MGEAWSRALLALAVVVVLLALLGAAGFYPVFLGLAVWAMLGPRQAIQALTVTWLVVMINPGLAEPPSSLAMLRWLPLLTASPPLVVRCLLSGILPGPALLLLGFGAVAAPSAWLGGYAPVLSNVRLLSLVLGLLPIILAYRLCSREEIASLQSWFAAVFVFIVIASLAMLASPTGYLVNGSFQGILNHPQGLGVVMGIMLAWLGGRLLLDGERGPMLAIVCVLGLTLLILSAARTGLVALTLGIALPGVAALVTRTPWAQRIRSAATGPATLLTVGCALLVGTLLYAAAPEILVDFVLKRQADVDIVTALEIARAGNIAPSIDNFLEHVWLGIGYGVPSDPRIIEVHLDPVFGIPVSAPTEKGIIFVALLEELGIVGATLLVVLFISIVFPTFRYGPPSGVCVVVASLASNLGEASLLSFGGHGMLLWLLIGLASASAAPLPERDAGQGRPRVLHAHGGCGRVPAL